MRVEARKLDSESLLIVRVVEAVIIAVILPFGIFYIDPVGIVAVSLVAVVVVVVVVTVVVALAVEGIRNEVAVGAGRRRGSVAAVAP